MRRLSLALLVIMLSSTVALGCGDVRVWTNAYWREAATDRNRQAALVELSSLCGSKTDADGDQRLLAVIRDAEQRQYDRALLRRVLEAHRCLPTVPRTADKAQLISAIGARCS
ncbi:hypothetical protein [Reyranella sp. CPCC 100927]|uniref:hypothetical protein n=1 Tax=Reyranella sp. CPCC 100927 TaxID=2599616 RepID=UPI0011B556CF|nr:hypothetical protein [Reyranella sp. CPCC 100927]TWT05682.1 hypothetical protein FQU96_24555 [Reyranella sp. CPCC 100927]